MSSLYALVDMSPITALALLTFFFIVRFLKLASAPEAPKVRERERERETAIPQKRKTEK